MTRLFVAVWPPDRVMDHVRSLPRHGWEGVRWTPEANWHVTLRFIGEADPARVTEALSNTELPQVTAAVGSALEILARTSLVVPVDGVDELASAVIDATRSIGRDDGDRRYRGHLTVGRSRGGRPIARNPSGTSGNRVVSCAAVSFEVGEVALVASDLLPDGAVYTTLATFTTFTTSGGGGR